jgi:light-regulated signal transduction histidine kinase (bacteriophytochrome)
MNNHDEIEKLKADCQALEEQVMLLVRIELQLRRTQAELLQSKEKIEEYNQTLEQKVDERTQKLNVAVKDLEAFAYSVSHDLRAPIRHIDGFSKLMYAKIPQPDALITGYYRKVENAIQRMSAMIDSLLAFSRLGRKEVCLEDFELESLVYEVIEEFKPDTETRKLKWVVSSLPKISGDRVLIKTVYENLISNAIKYTSKKNEAIIEIGSVLQSTGGYELYVKDNGAGFDMAYYGKLFGVFQRLHSSDHFDGIGIGLASVKQIVDKHQGTIRAEGKVDAGAAFYITLPQRK